MTERALVAYVRVSSTAKADHEPSATEQERAIRSRFPVIDTYRDEGVSGANGIEHRTGLPLALERIGSGEAQGLVVHRLDRLARELTVQEAILARVWSLGGSVWTVAGEVPRDDPDDPMRTAMRQMAGVFSELERRTVIMRLRGGKRAKRQGGGYIGGNVAYGQTVASRDYVPDEEELAAVRTMQRLRRKGRSYREIADHLTSHGVTTKRGGNWHATTVMRILQRYRRAHVRNG